MNKTYHIITIGCQMNKSDSERIAKYLEDYGFVLEQDKFKADLIVLTTCGVRQSAEDRIYGLVPRIKNYNPQAKIILTGCLVDRKDVRRRLKDKVDIWLPIIKLSGLADIGLPKSHYNSLQSYLSLSPKYESSFKAFVPIGNGCNNFCTYCVVPYARGREIYRDYDEIISEIKDLVIRGYREITLIAQNVNSYESNGYDFSDLLKMADQINGDFWISFATSHPKDMSDKLIQTIKNSRKICHHVHLPAQAGDNDVLQAMNRKYTIEHYLELIKKIRKALPDVNLTTDIIVGFPGETEKQFNQTKKLFKKAKYDMAYIAQYSPRYGTPAYKLEDNVMAKEKKRREQELIKLLSTALRNNKKYKGLAVKVLVDGQKHDYYIGHTSTHKTVKFIGKPGLIGKFVNVKINNIEDFGLSGKLINYV
ncbi:MAG: tRNA (N6-isopentenyl adenosine(37)-C2)-methylthiotransferase MiaB [bacterium]